MPSMLVGTTVNRVRAPPMYAPRLAVFGFFEANTRSIKSRAMMSPRPSASMAPQFISAPFPMSNSPDRSRNSGGAFAYMTAHGASANPPAKYRNPTQNAAIARYTWNRLVYADANRPPAQVYATTTRAENRIPQKKSIPNTTSSMNPLAARFPATRTVKLIIISTPDMPSAALPYLL